MYASFRVIGVFALTVALSVDALAGASNEALLTRSREDREGIFAEIVRTAERSCSQVTEVFYKGESTIDGADYYAIQCVENSYLVAMQNDGSNEATVVGCRTAKVMGSDCFEPFSAGGARPGGSAERKAR